ncbi:MAG: CBS domain-containing protein [Acidimicrobiales bacterium]|nr:CBS domain-containing protein [Acidimicrobiales bacterium]HRW37528.1 CBS domain-containing protein [Aquihabitans sp.]
MNVTVDELMQAPVMTITKHETVGHARTLMADHHVSALPVVGPDGAPLGIVTATDLLDGHGHPDGAPVSQVMSTSTYTVPRREGPHVAARIMRNHHLHHVVVVDDHRVVGMVSSFDLLKLVEDHRYVAKGAPTPARQAGGRR